MHDFRVLKNFNCNLKPPKAYIIKEILWSPPLNGWDKIQHWWYNSRLSRGIILWRHLQGSKC